MKPGVSERRSWWDALPIGVVGLVATGAAGWVSVVYAVLMLSWGCHGSDAGGPSTDSSLCTSAGGEVAAVAMVVLAIGGPLYGTIAATHHRSWRPLLVGIGVAVAAVAGFHYAFELT